MSRNRVLVALLSVLATAAIAHAQVVPKAGVTKPPPERPETEKSSPFDEIDTNHDGFISRDEFLAAQKKRFETFDSNHDGKIDAKEIANSPPLLERNMRIAERMVKQWDTNGDGVVTEEEFKALAEKHFKVMDKAGTGKIPRRTPPAMRPNPQQPKIVEPPQPVKH